MVYEVPMATIETEGFLKAYCRIWHDIDVHTKTF